MSYKMAAAISQKQLDKKFPQGIRVFAPRENAPSFVKGQIIITPNDLFQWLKDNPELLTDYQGNKQLKISILERKDGGGWNTVVDTYKPQSNGPDKDLPF
jgi:hypothetical protein